MEQHKTFILIISTVLCHGLLNTQEKKYGVHPTYDISRDDMQHGFKRMCIVSETLVVMVHFFIYAIMYILIYI
jgi:hypothetical protein